MDDDRQGGFIVIHRKLLKWEWYDDIYTKSLFLHLLLTANYESKKWHGITIERGQVLTSLNKLSEALSMSKSTVLKSLKKLESTGEIEIKPNPRYTLITICKYECYQTANRNEVEPTQTRIQSGFAGNRETKCDRSATEVRPKCDRSATQHNKENKDNKDNKEKKSTRAHARKKTCAEDIPAEVTERELTELYGIEATERYKKRFARWCAKNSVTGRDCIATIAQWMEQDGVKSPDKGNSSLNIEGIDQQILASYKNDWQAEGG